MAKRSWRAKQRVPVSLPMNLLTYTLIDLGLMPAAITSAIDKKIIDRKIHSLRDLFCNLSTNHLSTFSVA